MMNCRSKCKMDVFHLLPMMFFYKDVLYRYSTKIYFCLGALRKWEASDAL